MGKEYESAIGGRSRSKSMNDQLRRVSHYDTFESVAPETDARDSTSRPPTDYSNFTDTSSIVEIMEELGGGRVSAALDQKDSEAMQEDTHSEMTTRMTVQKDKQHSPDYSDEDQMSVSDNEYVTVQEGYPSGTYIDDAARFSISNDFAAEKLDANGRVPATLDQKDLALNGILHSRRFVRKIKKKNLFSILFR